MREQHFHIQISEQTLDLIGINIINRKILHFEIFQIGKDSLNAAVLHRHKLLLLRTLLLPWLCRRFHNRLRLREMVDHILTGFLKALRRILCQISQIVHRQIFFMMDFQININKPRILHADPLSSVTGGIPLSSCLYLLVKPIFREYNNMIPYAYLSRKHKRRHPEARYSLHYAGKCAKRRISMKMEHTETWKQSQYTVEVSRTEESVILYHTCTKALIRVPAEAYRQLLDIEHLQDPLSWRYLSSFQKKGFCIPAGIDEAAEFHERSLHAQQADTEELLFTIAPTTACNYRCSYCFEEGVPARTMHTEMIEKLCVFIEETAAHTPNCKGIGIKWFGGEPLLAFPIICQIASRIQRYCEAQGLSFHTRVITNGALLTEELLDTLEHYHLRTVQIAIDGSCDTYCRCKGASPADYRHIMQLLHRRCDRTHFVIRCNCLPDNLHTLMELADELYADEKIRQNIMLYPAQIRSERIPVLDAPGYAETELAFLRHLYTLGWFSQIRNALPARRTAPCESMQPQNYIIDASGDIFCCESHVGNHAARIASLDDSPEEIRLRKKSSCQNICQKLPKRCQNCTYYPVCFQGCPEYPRHEADCASFKQQILEVLKLFAHTVS